MRAGEAPLPAYAKVLKFAAVHGSIHNHVNPERHLSSRPAFKQRRAAALTVWRQLYAA
jgi:putative transposase